MNLTEELIMSFLLTIRGIDRVNSIYRVPIVFVYDLYGNWSGADLSI